MTYNNNSVNDNATNDLHVALIEGITCKCERSYLDDGDQLYFCNNKKCESEIYCKECGVFFHRRSKKSKKNKKNDLGHPFDVDNGVVVINDLVRLQPNKTLTEMGKTRLMRLLHNEKFKIVQGYIENAAIAVPAAASATTLIYELYAFYEAGKLVKFVSNAFKTKSVINYGGITAAIVTAGEICYNTFRWFSNEITGKEWFRLTHKSVVRNIASYSCIAGGTALGTALGTTVLPKLGTAIGTTICPGVGTAVGALLGVIVGVLAGMGVEALYAKHFPSGEEATRRKIVKSALTYFQFGENDINDPERFNLPELKRRMRRASLYSHPDRRGGDHSLWDQQAQYYGALKAICEDAVSKQDKIMIQKALDTDTIK